jgi:hypothetical protein
VHLQAILAVGGKPVTDNAANRYSFSAVHSLGARDGLEALLAVQITNEPAATRQERPVHVERETLIFLYVEVNVLQTGPVDEDEWPNDR